MQKRVMYIVRHGDSSYYKVGITRNFRDRLTALQSGNPLEVTPVAIIECYDEWVGTIESKIKELARPRNIRGEWFNLPELNNRPLYVIAAWLLECKLVIMEVKRVGGHYGIVVEKRKDIEPSRSKQEIDASLILLLDSRQARGMGGVRAIGVTRSLGYYYHDVKAGLDRLLHQGRLLASPGSWGKKRFWLKDKVEV